MHTFPFIDHDAHCAIEELLPAYVAGRLESRQNQTVGAHLTRCDGCRALLRGITELVGLPVDKAKVQIFHDRKHLKKILSGEAPDWL
jgi:anti-sigma factor ChrR (cupin superfamily)